MTEANAALLVSHDNEGGKTKATATLDHLRHPIDVNQAIDEITLFAFRLLLLTCHRSGYSVHLLKS
jgi:hypothetical protein